MWEFLPLDKARMKWIFSTPIEGMGTLEGGRGTRRKPHLDLGMGWPRKQRRLQRVPRPDPTCCRGRAQEHRQDRKAGEKWTGRRGTGK